jgi:hypothetical protein
LHLVDWVGKAGLPAVPGMAQGFTPREHKSSGFLEVPVDAFALDHVAGAAAGDEVVRMFPAFVSARHDEINGHDQSVFKAGLSIQTTIPAAIVITLQDFQAFRLSHGHLDSR